MRVLVLVKASKDCESGVKQDAKHLAEMAKYNRDLIKAGVLLSVDALQPSSQGARVRFTGGNQAVVDGPFVESKELVGGYWLWQVKSLREAIEWIRRAPFRDAEIEIRPIRPAEEAFGPDHPVTESHRLHAAEV
jgi:hypothetical protein